MENKSYDFEESLAYQIDYTANYNRAFRREFQSKFVNKDLSADECAILVAIHRNPTITQSGLGKLLFKGKAHVGKILNDLETRGYVTRTADTKDKIIIKRNVITQKGLDVIKVSAKEVQGRVESAMNKEFSQEEISKFIELMRKYRKVLSSIVEVKLK